MLLLCFPFLIFNPRFRRSSSIRSTYFHKCFSAWLGYVARKGVEWFVCYCTEVYTKSWRSHTKVTNKIHHVQVPMTSHSSAGHQRVKRNRLPSPRRSTIPECERLRKTGVKASQFVSPTVGCTALHASFGNTVVVPYANVCIIISV